MFPEAVTNTSAAHENFSGGQRLGTWAINSILPGVGSFVIMKDDFGGGIQLGFGVLAYILMIAGIDNIVKGSKTEYVRDDYGHGEYVNDQKALDDGIAATVIGGILLTGNGIFNIARSAMYTKPAPALAGGFDLSGLQIALLPGNKVWLSYTMHF